MPLPPVPKSGCKPIVEPIVLMIVLEFVSTGEAEMSLFQRLSVANGTNPLRLAPAPRLMALQDGELPPVPPLPPPEPPDPPEPPEPPEPDPPPLVFPPGWPDPATTPPPQPMRRRASNKLVMRRAFFTSLFCGKTAQMVPITRTSHQE